MILKVRRGVGKWYYQEIKKNFNKWGNHLIKDGKVYMVNNDNELSNVKVDFLFDDDDIRFRKRKYNGDRYSGCLVVTVDDDISIAFSGEGYLLNDQGKTIESL
jgi:hypothetical protein